MSEYACKVKKKNPVFKLHYRKTFEIKRWIFQHFQVYATLVRNNLIKTC